MKKLLVVDVMLSAVGYIYSLLLVQQHVLLLFTPVLLIPPPYLPLEVIAILLFTGWLWVTFAHALMDLLQENNNNNSSSTSPNNNNIK